MKNGEKEHTLREWIKQPASWLSLSAAFVSLSAAILSIATFYLVQASRGTLTIVLPVEVGVRYVAGNIEVLVPLTVTNTGAPRTRWHVVTVLAELRSEEQPRSTPVLLRWDIENKFMGYREFRKEYPDAREEPVEDYEVYVSRAAPFAVPGGQSMTKTMKFRQKSGVLGKSWLKRFKLTVIAKTEDEDFTQTALFKCGIEIGDAKTDWCERLWRNTRQPRAMVDR